MTIGRKLFASFGASLVVALCMGGLAIRNVGTLGERLQDLGDHSAAVLYEAGEVSRLTSDLLAATRGILVRGFMKQPDKVRSYNEQYAEYVTQVKKKAGAIIEGSQSAEIREIAQGEILDKIDALAQANQEMYEFTARGDFASAAEIYDHKLYPLAHAMSESGNRLATAERQVIAARATSDISVVGPAKILSVTMILLLIAIGAVVVMIVRGITSTLTSSISELREGADQVANAATQVSSSSQSLAQGASEQAASIEETSASSEEINSMARKNTDNSRTTAQLLAQSHEKVTQANRYLEEMVHSMDEINTSSGKISKIIKVIDEIAFQTNILALNAAVEAARAGEAGMGFAVVADEVRSLAQRSAQAAKDTASLIEESIAKSSEGKGKVDQVAEAIKAVTEDTAKIKVMIDEVSLGSEEQSRGIDQIGRAISQMEQVTQTTAANAEESAAAAEELNAQSQTMQDVVSRLHAMVDQG
jgi:methyl-accepting chemotaxis protein